MTMDKSVNNFDDVEDTMTSVYTAWRKKSKPQRGHLISCNEKKSISRSLSLTLWVSFSFGTYFIILITSNNEHIFLFFALLLDSLNSNNPTNHTKKIPKTKVPANLFSLQTKCWNLRVLAWPSDSTISSVKCSSSRRRFCHSSRPCRRSSDASTTSIAIHHAYHRQPRPTALMKQQSRTTEVSSFDTPGVSRPSMQISSAEFLGNDGRMSRQFDGFGRCFLVL